MDFKNVEVGLSYQTGFVVNDGLIPRLLEDDDVSVSDELNHGRLIGRIRL